MKYVIFLNSFVITHYFMHIIMLTFAVNQAVIMNIMRDTRDTMFLKCN